MSGLSASIDALKLGVVGVDRQRDLLGAAAHPLAQRARRLDADIARRRRKEHEADHVGAGVERRVERLGGLQAADFDQKGHDGRGSSALTRRLSTRHRSAACYFSAFHTSMAAARSSSAVPIDLNSVISSLRLRPFTLPRQSSNRSPWMSFRLEDLFLQRNGDIARALRRARAGVDIDAGAAHRGVVGLARLRREGADQIDMGALLQPGALDQRLGRQRRAGHDVGLAHRLLQIVGDDRLDAGGRQRERGRDRVRAGAVPQGHARDRPHRAVRADQMRR